jgi:hypothetical protein
MSMTGAICDRFEEAVAKLVEETRGHIDGLNIAHILQRAATKALKSAMAVTAMTATKRVLRSSMRQGANSSKISRPHKSEAGNGERLWVCGTKMM